MCQDNKILRRWNKTHTVTRNSVRVRENNMRLLTDVLNIQNVTAVKIAQRVGGGGAEAACEYKI